MSNKDLLAAYMLLSTFADVDSNESDKENKHTPLQDDQMMRHEKRQQEIERKKKKGLKEFRYGSAIIYALNKKNADRKARKQGLI